MDEKGNRSRQGNSVACSRYLAVSERNSREGLHDRPLRSFLARLKSNCR